MQVISKIWLKKRIYSCLWSIFVEYLHDREVVDGKEMSGSLIDIAVSAIGGDELLPWESENLENRSGGDGSPTLSNFSSCEESDFERYCSANSVMGTPNMCSSVGNSTDLFGVSDFGSLKNLGFGGEEISLESCDLLEASECDFRTPMNATAVGKTSTSCGDESIRESGVSSSRSQFHRSKFPFSAGNRNAFQLSSHDGTTPVNDNVEQLRLSRVGGERDSLSSLKNDLSHGSVLSDLAVNGLPQIPMSLAKDDVDPLLSREGHECSGLVGSSINIFPADTSQPNDSIQLASEVTDGTTFLSDAEEGTAFLSYVKEGTAFLSDAEEGKGDMVVGAEMDLVASDKCNDSDEDGLMFNYGTDEEIDIDIHKYNSSNSKYTGETKIDNEIPLLINSAVTFGVNDWDDFEQEALDHGLDIVSLHKIPKDHTSIEGTTEDVYDIHMSAPYDKVESESFSPDFSQICFAAHSTDRKAFLMQDDQEVKCLETGSPAIEKFVEVVDDTSEMKSSCTLISACTSSEDYLTSKTYLLNPLSDVTPDVSSSATSKVLQQRVEPVESEIVANVCCTQAITPSATDLGCELPGELQREGKSQENYEHKAISVMTRKEHALDVKQNLSEDHLSGAHKVENLDTFAFYEEMIHDMEKILLNSVESRGSKLSLTADGNPFSQHQQFRDGGSTASTSGRDNTNLSNTYPLKIDWIEVIGAKQLRGDVSLADRLVGVKEYTVYKIRVWSGREQWEIEHRYRDFFHLYRQLKAIYTERGKVLPLPWLKVERESQKLFGSASPTVVNERSFLIQECLRSILDLQSESGIPNCVLLFLSPSKSLSKTSFSNHPGSDSMLQSLYNIESHRENILMLGNTVSLIVDIRPRKPIKQALEAQHYLCAGCHKHFDNRKSLMSDFVQKLGWGKPRVCEYTGQLFCVSCHTNETAVLPSRVLHNWDFALYPISQLAKAYLESIYERPMLCVTAVNPLLFSKVPALFHLMNMRKKIASMVQYVRCPFRRSIQTGLGSRRYLLESSEFFALRDLVDLSKGPFAALPVMMDNISRKIIDHITQQCLVCCDVGIMCGSRRACEDPSSLIFPFQEDEIQRCKFCKSAFHKPCYMKLMSCPCGKPLDGRVLPVEQAKRISTNESIGDSMLVARKQNSESVVGYFSEMFSKAKSDITGETRDRNPVILMGYMPSTSL